MFDFFKKKKEEKKETSLFERHCYLYNEFYASLNYTYRETEND